MKKIIVDTNGILRLLLNDIPRQADEIENLIKKAKKEQIVLFLPQIVIFEIDFTLEKLYKFKKQEVIEKLKSLLSATYFVVESKNLFKKALDMYEKNSSVSLPDCFLYAYAESENAELFTFDKKLKKLR